jgi:hypothetical protein
MKFKLTKFKPKSTQIKGLECLNCGQPLSGDENFCSNCGQKNTIKKLSFGVFVNNIFSGFFSYDSRFWTTFIPLLTKPGKVSKDYIEGKRARFVNPFQLYLNVSIIFFLILGISNKIDSNNIANDISKATKNLDSITKVDKKKLDSIITNVQQQVIDKIPDDSTKVKTIAEVGNVFKLYEPAKNVAKMDSVNLSEPDSTKWMSITGRLQLFYEFKKNNPDFTNEQMLDSLGLEKTFWNKFYSQQAISMGKNYDAFKEDGGKAYFKKLTSYISISLFIFLPIFTLFLKLIYIRRKYTYMEHLVFVFNTQTVFFLLLIIFYLCSFFFKMDNFGWIFALLFLIYLYKALRYFYEQGRAKTIIKYVLLNSYYMFLALVGFTIVAILSFFIS